MAAILVVDDSLYLTKMTSLALESEGHEVVAVGHDGQQGLDLYKEHKPDLTLLDITMPNKGGRYCLEEILAFDPTAKIVMVSAVSQASVVLACLKIGALDFVKKPLNFTDEEFCKQFHATIDNALNADTSSRNIPL